MIDVVTGETVAQMALKNENRVDFGSAESPVLQIIKEKEDVTIKNWRGELDKDVNMSAQKAEELDNKIKACRDNLDQSNKDIFDKNKGYVSLGLAIAEGNYDNISSQNYAFLTQEISRVINADAVLAAEYNKLSPDQRKTYVDNLIRRTGFRDRVQKRLEKLSDAQFTDYSEEKTSKDQAESALRTANDDIDSKQRRIEQIDIKLADATTTSTDRNVLEGEKRDLQNEINQVGKQQKENESKNATEAYDKKKKERDEQEVRYIDEVRSIFVDAVNDVLDADVGGAIDIVNKNLDAVKNKEASDRSSQLNKLKEKCQNKVLERWTKERTYRKRKYLIARGDEQTAVMLNRKQIAKDFSMVLRNGPDAIIEDMLLSGEYAEIQSDPKFYNEIRNAIAQDLLNYQFIANGVTDEQAKLVAAQSMFKGKVDESLKATETLGDIKKKLGDKDLLTRMSPSDRRALLTDAVVGLGGLGFLISRLSGEIDEDSYAAAA